MIAEIGFLFWLGLSMLIAGTAILYIAAKKTR